MPQSGSNRPTASRSEGGEGRAAAAERFMALALEQAAKGVGRTHPNPPVGALVVVNGEVVGRGFHSQAGRPHAEVEALKEAGARAKGADMYVTLEPCSHFGRTPPCVQAVLASGIRRVFIGSIDPNPLVSGQGVKRLRDGGVEVRTGVFAESCDALIAGFSRYIQTGRPYVVLKAGSSLDGKIATASGASKWITGPESRAHVHRMRDELDAVLVGAGTVIADDPLLNVRLDAPVVPGRSLRNPVRVVLDGALRCSPEAQVFDVSLGEVIVATCVKNGEAIERLRARGVNVVTFEGADGRIDPDVLLKELGRRGLTTLLVEGGSDVHRAFLAAGIVDELRLFLAPKVLGADGLSWAGPLGLSSPDESPSFRIASVERSGQDLLVVARPAPVDEEERT